MYNASAIITKSGVFDTIASGALVSGDAAGFAQSLKRANKEVITTSFFNDATTGDTSGHNILVGLNRGLSNIRNYTNHSGYTGLFGGIVTSNGDSFPAYNAFNKNTVLPWFSSIVHNSYIQYQFYQPERAETYGIRTESALLENYGSLRRWSLSGSKDGIDWKLLDYQETTPPNNVYVNYSISGSKQDLYSYYRVFIYQARNTADTQAAIWELDFINTGEKIPLWSEVQIKTPDSGISPYSGKNNEALGFYGISGGYGVRVYQSGNMVYYEATGLGAISSTGVLLTVTGSNQLQGVYDISGIGGINARLQGSSILIDGTNVAGNGGGISNGNFSGYYLKQSSQVINTGIFSNTIFQYTGTTGFLNTTLNDVRPSSLIKISFRGLVSNSNVGDSSSFTFFRGPTNLLSGNVNAGATKTGINVFFGSVNQTTLNVSAYDFFDSGISGSQTYSFGFCPTAAGTAYLNRRGTDTLTLGNTFFEVEEWASGLPTFGYANKAWLTYSGANGGTSPTLYSSGNISSVVRNGSGDYTIYFQTGFADTYYLASYAGRGTSAAPVFITEQNDTPFRVTTGVRIYNLNQSFSGKDDAFVTCEWKSY